MGCLGSCLSTAQKQTERASAKFIEKHIFPMTSDVSRNRQHLWTEQVVTPHFFWQVKGTGSPYREAETKARVNQLKFVYFNVL